MKNQLYLDHAATTPMHPEVVEVMVSALTSHYGNASSTHQLGRESKGLLEEARVVFAKSIHAKPEEIIITSGGTESDNMAIVKTAEKMKAKGRHIITTNIEHPAVKNPIQYLEKNGYEVTWLPVNKQGTITVDQVMNSVREDTILVSIIYGNNEIGSLMPIGTIGKSLNELDHEVVFHTDAVQAYGTEHINVDDQYIDLLSVSAHKINGPKGIGFLYMKDNLNLPSLMMGGEQEKKRRAGTENIPAIVGFKRAVELRQSSKADLSNKYEGLKLETIERLKETGIAHAVNGSLTNSLPHILSVHIQGVSAEKLLIHLDLAGIAVSIGSACSAGNIEPSHVLSALYGEDHPAIAETIRISFGYGSESNDVLKVVKVIEKAVAFLKKT
ncbi:MAG: cysteine desulfurase [Alkalibacterium sp.]|nr:cysteine desulfurase [Alkalibacterium sp.]TVP92424.1 MAG: cysteine desulfurase [Alkalibacterium sp.]